MKDIIFLFLLILILIKTCSIGKDVENFQRRWINAPEVKSQIRKQDNFNAIIKVGQTWKCESKNPFEGFNTIDKVTNIKGNYVLYDAYDENGNYLFTNSDFVNLFTSIRYIINDFTIKEKVK